MKITQIFQLDLIFVILSFLLLFHIELWQKNISQ